MTEKRTFGGASGDAPPVVRQVQEDIEPNGEVPGSLMDQLREAAARQQQEKIKDFVVGGEFGKQLWIRYKPLDPGPMDTMIARRSRMREMLEANPRADLPVTELALDMMAQGCVAVLGADVNGENKQILEDEYGPVRLEHRLITLLGMPVPPQGSLTARESIMLLFGNNAMAVMDHSDDVLEWMRDPSARVNPGES